MRDGAARQFTAKVLGYGMSGDAYHMTDMPDDAAGMANALRQTLRRAEFAARRCAIHQRARHFDADQRRNRNLGRQNRIRRPCAQISDVFDQIANRPSAWAPVPLSN